MSTAYLIAIAALSVVLLVAQLAQGWSAVWILFAVAGIGIAVASLGGDKYRGRARRRE